MRFIAFITAVIVLALGFVPCADAAYAMKSGKLIEISKGSAQQQDKDHNDACSPFCQCACCAGFSINHTFNPISTLPINCTKQLAFYLPANLIEISIPVWQPPKLAA